MNTAKVLLASGKACINGWLSIPDGYPAEVMAQCGFDSLTVDLQHGVQDYLSMIRCFQAIGRYPVAPLVRVPWNEPGIIGKVLDGGALGVICPMINNPREARQLVDACLYPPLGKRSNGPIRAGALATIQPYQSIANDEVLIMPMIETAEAIENLEAILDVPHISGVYIGPSDLGLSMGLPPVLDREEPEILEIYRRILTAVTRRSLFAGIHNATGAYAVRMLDMGFRFVTVASDGGLIARAGREQLFIARRHDAARQ